ncbi:MAG: aspartate--tRNA(Asn) ligase [Christensenellaceae bacterium]|nr:aspartate--tRNA(Asn) ligase [Christensenellaceae bacterium]
MRTLIKELKAGSKQQIAGFVEKVRDQKNIAFIILRDISSAIQVTVLKKEGDALTKSIEGLTPYSVIKVEGELKQNPAVKLGGVEFMPSEIEVLSAAETPPIDEKSSIDQRLDYRWIDLRAPEKALIFKAQTVLVDGMRRYLLDNGFVEMHSPKIISEPSESGSDLFTVDYFGEKAYLAQSPQFYKQMGIASGFERYFEIAPVFRAEKSFTNKHATEFTGFDVEFAYIDSYNDIMKLEEEMLVAGIKAVSEKYGTEIKELLNIEIEVPKLPFKRITLSEAARILREQGQDIEDGDDLSTETERALGEYMKAQGHEFYFVTDYPADIRAFYHMKDPKDQSKALGYDLYFKGMEITTGAQREHRYEQLKTQAISRGLTQEKIQFYLDFFRYGCPPHGGFGIGVERITMLLLGVPTIKEMQYIFRGPTRIKP